MYTTLHIGCPGPGEWNIPACERDVVLDAAEYQRAGHVPIIVTEDIIDLARVFEAMKAVKAHAAAHGKRIAALLSGHAGMSVRIAGNRREWFFFLGVPTKDKVLWWSLICAWMIDCADSGIKGLLRIDACHAGAAHHRGPRMAAQTLYGKGVNLFDDQADDDYTPALDDRIPKGWAVMGACKGRKPAYANLPSIYDKPAGNSILSTDGRSLWTFCMTSHMKRGVKDPEKLHREVNRSMENIILGCAPNVYNQRDVQVGTIRDRGWAAAAI
ncbi:MAG: hypothetical protein GX573_21745 [Chloroflexi bacterium]|nr:hypothetical protein [Chloroflexota bacterium]